jgi:ribose transport system ATP-binding protein
MAMERGDRVRRMSTTNLGAKTSIRRFWFALPMKQFALGSLAVRALLATAALLVIGAIVAPSAVSASAFLSILPFVAILAVASIGQHLVIQQRGLDISIAGVMSFAAVIVTAMAPSGAGIPAIASYILLALFMGLASGAASGAVITLLRVPPLVTTIGMNAVLFGATLMVSHSVPSAAPLQLAQFAIGLTLGAPNTIWVALAVSATAVIVMGRTTIGRRFIAASVNPAAAYAVAIPVERYRIATYMAAGLCYAIAGVMLAGFLSIPNIFCGNPYILASVAAVVIGGNSVAGGERGSILATIVGAFFLTFLSQLVLSVGLERSMQNIVQAVIVIGGVALPKLTRRRQSGAAGPSRAVVAPSDAAEAAPVDAQKPALRLAGVRKAYGAVEALKNVDFVAYPGEVHAIVGENGAGKSTLIGIASGVIAADAGSIALQGKPLTGQGARERRRQGISVAYQHPALAPDLSVLENLQLAEPELIGLSGVERAERLIASIATAELRMDVRQRVGELSLAQRHVVEIARALVTEPTVLFLDEPTEPFQQADIQQLFALIKSLRDRGVAIVYVSHRLPEIAELADRVSIMRDGEMVACRLAREIAADEIIALIAGRPLGQIFPRKCEVVGAPMLEATGFSGADFAEVSLTVHAGEIIGLAGVEGEGQREFLRALAGVDRHSGGQIRVAGAAVGSPGPSAARAAGFGFVPDDRHVEGLFLNLSVRENIAIGTIGELSSNVFVDRGAEARSAQDVLEGFRIRAPSIETSVADLSGGNQQKVLFGREIAAHPKVLLVDEPTKGVDIGARTEIYQRLRALARDGMAVVVSSSDGVELEGLCDRVFIFARGHIVRELVGEAVTDRTITEANLTATISRTADVARFGERGLWRRLFASDHFPAVILICLTLGILFGTNAFSEYFLSAFNITQMTALLAILGFIALAQFATIMVGGIDLSVGPLAGFVVVLASFLLPSGASAAQLAAGGLLLIGFCLLFGYAQGLLITTLRLPAIVVTLASFIGLQGLSLLLRPRPKGTISNTLSDIFGYPVFGAPLGMILALVAFVIGEWLLYRHAIGRQIRAVGSNPSASLRLGVNGGRVTRLAFTAAGALTGVAGLMLAGQIGIGSGTTGVDFSLMSITAVVLGGVSVAGGRGSVLCVLCGAALVQSTTSASSFLNADSSWQYAVVGGITLIAACLFSLARRPYGGARLAF